MTFTERHCIECDVSSVFRYRDIFNCASGLAEQGADVKVDIKGSILIELSGVLHTSPNYLPGMEEYEEGLLEIITVYKNLKGSKTKQIALEQMKLLATMSSEL